MTLVAWANVRTFANNGRIVARDAESGLKAWGLGVENSANWNFAVPATSASRTNLFVPFNPAITTNTWVHVAGYLRRHRRAAEDEVLYKRSPGRLFGFRTRGDLRHHD